MQFGAWTLPFGALVACAPTASPPNTTSSPAHTTTAATRVTAAVAEPAALSPLEREHLDRIDPLRWFFAHEQPLPPPPEPIARQGAFPGTAFSSLEGVAIATDRDALRIASCEHGDGNSYPAEGPIAGDGRYCSNVVHPAVVLSAEQQGRLLKFLEAVTPYPPAPDQRPAEPNDNQHRAKRARLRCGYAPTHAFVFRDARRRPIASVAVELTGACSEQWLWWPAREWSGSLMAASESAFFSALCQELKLPGCSDGYAEFTKSAAAARLAPHERDPLGAVDGVKPLAMLSLREKQRMCARYGARMVAIMRAPQGAPKMYSGLECVGSPPMQYLSVEECVASFPSCDRPVASATKCWNALVTSPPCSTPRPLVEEACGARLECAVGIRSKPD